MLQCSCAQRDGGQAAEKATLTLTCLRLRSFVIFCKCSVTCVKLGARPMTRLRLCSCVLPFWVQLHGGQAGANAIPTLLTCLRVCSCVMLLWGLSNLTHSLLHHFCSHSFMEDKLRQKDATADKLRLKNTTTKALITKLEHQLAHKEEMGEVGGPYENIQVYKEEVGEVGGWGAADPRLAAECHLPPLAHTDTGEVGGCTLGIR